MKLKHQTVSTQMTRGIWKILIQRTSAKGWSSTFFLTQANLVVYLIVRGQNQLNIKMLNWYSAPITTVTWCHYVCADLPYKTTFTQEKPFICPLCSPRETPLRSDNNILTSSQYNSRGLPIRRAALAAKRKLRQRK